MKPTVGRIVIFRQPANAEPVNDTREHPAIVTRVWSDDYVNLHVFYDGAPSAPYTSVRELDREIDDSWGWRWPEHTA